MDPQLDAHDVADSVTFEGKEGVENTTKSDEKCTQAEK
jgi:hypothetical protein